MTHVGPERSELLAHVERYYDAVPRTATDATECGPFTLFVSRSSWTYYARPRLGLASAVTAADVSALRVRQVELGVPETLEWVPAITPSLESAAVAAGLEVHTYPLMVLTAAMAPAEPSGFDVRLLAADDPHLSAVLDAVHRGFGSDGAQDEEVTLVRERIALGLQVVAGAFDADGAAVGGGAHQPVDGVTELVGIAVAPEVRRRGIGAALAAALVAGARRQGVNLIFLSAGDASVARTYARVGFEQVTSVSAAEPPTPTHAS